MYHPATLSGNDGLVSAKKLFGNILASVGSYRRVVHKIEWSLAHLRGANSLVLTIDMVFPLFAYGLSAREGRHITGEPDFVLTIMKAKSFWRSLFQVLTEEAHNSSLETRPRSDVDLCELVVHLVESVLASAVTHIPAESSDFARVLVRVGMFDALDEALQHFGSVSVSGKFFTNPVALTFSKYTEFLS